MAVVGDPDVKLDVYVRVGGKEIVVGTIEIPVRVTAGYRLGQDETDNASPLNLGSRLRLPAPAR